MAIEIKLWSRKLAIRVRNLDVDRGAVSRFASEAGSRDIRGVGDAVICFAANG